MALSKIGRRLTNLRYAFLRFVTDFQPLFLLLMKVVGGIAFLASILCIVAGTVFIGFDHSQHDSLLLTRLIRTAQIIFIVKVIYSWTFCYRTTRRDSKWLKWIADVAIVLTLPSLVYPHPEHPWIPFLEQIFYDKHIIFSIVGFYAVTELCFGITRILDRRMNPSLMLATSFLFLIIIGSFLLMMPRCTVDGIGYIDSLFVSTSAVCITGLSSVDVASTFTPFGILILALMIQIGGLGVMTFTSFFALFFSGSNSIYSQMVVKDMIQSKTINSLLPTLLYILGFTLAVELIGAVGIFLSVHGTLNISLEDELIFSAFHSLSAFCNAGFSNIEGGMANPALLHSSQMVYIVASALIFAGGLGFPILVNLKSAIGGSLRRLWHKAAHRRRRFRAPIHIYDMNTRLAITTTLIIFGLSAVLFFIFEYNNTLAGMSLYDKIVQSIFNAFVPRSSGFSSLPTVSFMSTTVIMMMMLMWIGGGSQSTAGGIKVNTFAVILLELRAVVTGRRRVVAYNRTIAGDSIRRAGAIVTLSIVAYFVYSLVLVALEPSLSVRSLLFESASALFTVGSSMGITPDLTDTSKVLLCTAMFLGRVGIISMLVGFVGRHNDPPVKYPIDKVIIN